MNQLSDKEVWIKTIEIMRRDTTHPYVISVFDKMLDEMRNSGEFHPPRYYSIINFGYDIFSFLNLEDCRVMLEQDISK